MTLLIRTTGAPAAVIPIVRRAVSDAHPGLAVVSASPLETLLDAPRAQPRLNATVLALFAAAAVSVAAIGLFAIIATMVRQCTHELAIRMALGATSGRVRRMIMVRGLSLGAAGAAIGMAGALAANRLLSALLFEISPPDGAIDRASRSGQRTAQRGLRHPRFDWSVGTHRNNAHAALTESTLARRGDEQQLALEPAVHWERLDLGAPSV